MTSAPSNASLEQHRMTARARANASRRPQPLIDALVPDAHLNAAVAGIRGLGLGGMRVMALGPSWTSPGLWSRHTAGARRRAERGARARRAGGPDRDDWPPSMARWSSTRAARRRST